MAPQAVARPEPDWMDRRALDVSVYLRLGLLGLRTEAVGDSLFFLYLHEIVTVIDLFFECVSIFAIRKQT